MYSSRGATASLLTLPNEATEDWWKHSGTPECVPALNCLNHDLLQQFRSSDFAPFFSQGLICSNSKGLMHTAKQPEIALHGATFSSVCVCVFDGVGVGTKMMKLKASHFKGSSAPTWAQKPSCACQGKMLLVKALALASWLRLTSHRALLWIGKMAHCLPRGLHGFWLMPRLGKSNCHGSWLNVA